MSGDLATFSGTARVLGPDPGVVPTGVPVRVTFEDDGFSLAMAGGAPIIASYRDVTVLAAEPNAATVTLGEGDAAMRIRLDGFGARQDLVASTLRERRTRQRLADRFVQLPDDPLEVFEYQAGDEQGQAQLAFQPWAAELMPLDESRALIHVRRAEIGAVEADPSGGTVRVSGLDPDHPAVELRRLGSAVTRLANRFTSLRDGAHADATATIAALIPDAPFATRQRLSSLVVDGRPAEIETLGPDGALLEATILNEPTFAESYRTLVGRASAAEPARRWLSTAPVSPGGPESKAWFFVALPGNLVALELVTAGAHATYLFRVVPRAAFGGESPAALGERLDAAVAALSNALVDARFLREPMALPAGRLAEARYVHYRLALAALPSLSDARGRFVARLIHDDPVRWAAALDDLIAWHEDARDDGAEWPGRSAEESSIPQDSADQPMPSQE